MEQSTYWNSVAQKRNFTTTFQENEFCKYVDKNAKVLDVGCGYGRTMNELYKSGYKNLIGADTAVEMINRGKREFPYLKFVKSGAELPFDDDTFDAVILFGVLCSVVSDDSHLDLINEIKRVLKPNGVIYVNDFLINTSIPYKLRYKKFEKEFGIYG
ncbi:MAG: class I SAM-dependent methyltransferase, partial [Eubacterium sp.]|nr:class I SAM-dependent methyltransferase [Eubacterium sp.]